MPENPIPHILLNQPPAYVTSDAVRSAISLAISTKKNPRGLESFWYGAYAHIFTDLANPYKGSVVYHPQFTLSIPTLVAQLEKLRSEFQDAGLNWDDSEPAVHVDENDVRDILKDLEATPIGTRRSSRISEQNESKAKADEDKLNRRRTDLRQRKAVLVKAMESDDKDEVADVSTDTTKRVAEPDAGDKIPDIVLSHIASVKLPDPVTDEDELYNSHRAGLKVFHHCIALVGEVKRAPPGPSKPNEIREHIVQAQNDLVVYCAAFFSSEPKSESVIAFAAAGLFWRWAVIKKEEVPELNWLTNKPIPGQEKLLVNFHRRFTKGVRKGRGQNYFQLRTPESDAELTEINRDHIHPFIQKHTGPGPKWDAENKRWY